MAKSRTYSLYLLKDGLADFEDVFTPGGKERIKAGDAKIIESNGLGERASVYLFENMATPPNWLSDVSSVFDGVPALRNKSSSAVVVFQHVGRVFASTFAHGWQFIDDTKIEADFGLRVAINSLDDSKVRRIDSSHLGEAMKGVSQSAFQRDLQAFGIDEALDLVRRGLVTDLFRSFDLVFCRKGERKWQTDTAKNSSVMRCA